MRHIFQSDLNMSMHFRQVQQFLVLVFVLVLETSSDTMLVQKNQITLEVGVQNEAVAFIDVCN